MMAIARPDGVDIRDRFRIRLFGDRDRVRFEYEAFD